jgi:hypothetical protein
MDGLTTSLTRRTWRRRRPRKQPAPDDVALARRRASEMMQSDLVTVFSLGKQVKAIVADGAINEEDERAIESLVKRQQAVWNIILLMTTLMVGRLYGSLSSVNALTDARSSALGDTAQSRVLVVAYVLILSLSAVIMSTCMCGTVILYVYSHLLIDFDDVVWFVCERVLGGRTITTDVYPKPLSMSRLTWCAQIPSSSAAGALCARRGALHARLRRRRAARSRSDGGMHRRRPLAVGPRWFACRVQ